MKKTLALALIALVLTACAAPVAPTPVVQYVVVTATPAATIAATEIPPTATVVPTATPDLRVIDMNPREIILERVELPEEGHFVLFREKPYRNAEIASQWTIEKGSKYLDEAGRVDGWENAWYRTTRAARAAEYVTLEGVLFETSAGPEYARAAWGNVCQSDRIEGIALLDDDLGFGDASYLCVERFMQPSGQNYIVYSGGLDYRNVEVLFWVEGMEKEFDQAFAKEIVRLQFEKLVALPLSEIVMWEP